MLDGGVYVAASDLVEEVEYLLEAASSTKQVQKVRDEFDLTEQEFSARGKDFDVLVVVDRVVDVTNILVVLHKLIADLEVLSSVGVEALHVDAGKADLQVVLLHTPSSDFASKRIFLLAVRIQPSEANDGLLDWLVVNVEVFWVVKDMDNH